MNLWIDDNPFCDLPHGYEFHLDYFDRFVLQAPWRRGDQAHFSWLLTSWLENRNQPWRKSNKDEEGEDSPGPPSIAHRGVSTRSEAEGIDPGHNERGLEPYSLWERRVLDHFRIWEES